MNLRTRQNKPPDKVRQVKKQAKITQREICGLVAELNQTIEAHVRHASERLALTAAQAVALRELDSTITLKELARRMCCEPSNTTFVVDKLEALGFLERGPHPDDRRAKLLFLTDAGKDKRAEVIAELSKSSPLSSLTEDEKYRLSELLYRAIAT